MTNDELRKILKWAEHKEKFIWSELQTHFNYDNQKMVLIQNILRSNMPAKNNLVDHLYISGEDSNIFVLTSNGRTMLMNLENSLSKNTGILAGGPVTAGRDIIVGGKKVTGEKRLFKNRWYQKPVGIIMLAVISGLIIAGFSYLLGWG